MSLNGRYDAQNVFARMLRGEISSTRVFEDDAVMALMDLYPQAEGHVLVISKTSQARNILEVEAEVLSTLMLQVQRIARAVAAALTPDGILIVQANGSAAGQTVFHLHVHVIPRYENALRPHGAGQPADSAGLAAFARRIRAELD